MPLLLLPNSTTGFRSSGHTQEPGEENCSPRELATEHQHLCFAQEKRLSDNGLEAQGKDESAQTEAVKGAVAERRRGCHRETFYREGTLFAAPR